MQSLKHSFILNGVESGIDCSKSSITAVQKRDHATHRFIPCGEEATKMIAQKLGGESGSALTEIYWERQRQHIMSGVAMGNDKSEWRCGLHRSSLWLSKFTRIRWFDCAWKFGCESLTDHYRTV